MATTTKSTTGTRKSTPAGRTTRSRTVRSTTTAATNKVAKAKAEIKPAMPAAPTEPDATPKADAPEMFRRPDLIKAVAERSALKRSDAKMVLELVLEELGKALDAQDELALQPLGKLSVKRRKTTGNGEMLTVKLKRASKDTVTGLAADSDPASE